MSTTHVNILTALDDLADHKGLPGRVSLQARLIPGPAAADSAPTADSSPNDGCPAGKRDTVFSVGEYVRLVVRSPIDGYLHIFDLGTDGTCDRLIPSPRHCDNRVVSGREHSFPENLPEDIGWPMPGSFELQGPTSAASGQPNRLLAVVTADDLTMDARHVHPALQQRVRSTREVGKPQVRFESSRLLNLPPERWEYGLLELEVR